MNVEIGPLGQVLLSHINEMSRISFMEQVRLRCTFEYYSNKLDYGCNEIYEFMLSSGKTEAYAKIQELALRERNGCNAHDRNIKLSPFILKTCVCNMLHKSFNHLMILHTMYEKGILYEDGGVAGQPSKFMEYMAYISYLKDLYTPKPKT